MHTRVPDGLPTHARSKRTEALSSRSCCSKAGIVPATTSSKHWPERWPTAVRTGCQAAMVWRGGNWGTTPTRQRDAPALPTQLEATAGCSASYRWPTENIAANASWHNRPSGAWRQGQPRCGTVGRGQIAAAGGGYSIFFPERQQQIVFK